MIESLFKLRGGGYDESLRVIPDTSKSVKTASLFLGGDFNE